MSTNTNATNAFGLSPSRNSALTCSLLHIVDVKDILELETSQCPVSDTTVAALAFNIVKKWNEKYPMAPYGLLHPAFYYHMRIILENSQLTEKKKEIEECVALFSEFTVLKPTHWFVPVLHNNRFVLTVITATAQPTIIIFQTSDNCYKEPVINSADAQLLTLAVLRNFTTDPKTVAVNTMPNVHLGELNSGGVYLVSTIERLTYQPIPMESAENTRLRYGTALREFVVRNHENGFMTLSEQEVHYLRRPRDMALYFRRQESMHKSAFQQLFRNANLLPVQFQNLRMAATPFQAPVQQTREEFLRLWPHMFQNYRELVQFESNLQGILAQLTGDQPSLTTSNSIGNPPGLPPPGLPPPGISSSPHSATIAVEPPNAAGPVATTCPAIQTPHTVQNAPRDLPAAIGPGFNAGMRDLWQAIRQNSPQGINLDSLFLNMPEDIQFIRKNQSQITTSAVFRILYHKVEMFNQRFGGGRMALVHPEGFFQFFENRNRIDLDAKSLVEKNIFFKTDKTNRYLIPAYYAQPEGRHFILLFVLYNRRRPVVVVYDSLFNTKEDVQKEIQKFAALLLGIDAQEVQLIRVEEGIIPRQPTNGCGIEVILNAEQLLQNPEFDPQNLVRRTAESSDTHRIRLSLELEEIHAELGSMPLTVQNPDLSPSSSVIIIEPSDDSSPKPTTPCDQDETDDDHEYDHVDEIDDGAKSFSDGEAVEEPLRPEKRTRQPTGNSTDTSESESQQHRSKVTRRKSKRLATHAETSESSGSERVELIDAEYQKIFCRLPAMSEHNLHVSSTIPDKFDEKKCIYCGETYSTKPWNQRSYGCIDYQVQCGYRNEGGEQCKAQMHFSCALVAQPLHGYDSQYLTMDRNFGLLQCFMHFCQICFSDGMMFSSSMGHVMYFPQDLRGFHDTCVPIGAQEDGSGTLCKLYNHASNDWFTGPRVPYCAFCCQIIGSYKDGKKTLEDRKLIQCDFCVNSFHEHCTKASPENRCRRCVLNEQTERGALVMLFHEKILQPGICEKWSKVSQTMQHTKGYRQLGYVPIRILTSNAISIVAINTISRVVPFKVNALFITLRDQYNGNHDEILEMLRTSLQHRPSSVPRFARPLRPFILKHKFHHSVLHDQPYASGMKSIMRTHEPLPPPSNMIVKTIPPKGRGIVTTKSLKEGVELCDYLGEIVSEKEYKKRTLLAERNEKLDKESMDYAYTATVKWYNHFERRHESSYVGIDSAVQMNQSALCNTSCEPNLEASIDFGDFKSEDGTVSLQRIVQKTIRPCRAGEELCTNYKWKDFHCLCGTPSCQTIPEDWDVVKKP